MKGYKVEMMTHADAVNYYGGGYNYKVETKIVTAETKEKAIEKAKKLYPEMEINRYHVVEVEIPEGHTEQMTLTDLL